MYITLVSRFFCRIGYCVSATDHTSWHQSQITHIDNRIEEARQKVNLYLCDVKCYGTSSQGPPNRCILSATAPVGGPAIRSMTSTWKITPTSIKTAEAKHKTTNLVRDSFEKLSWIRSRPPNSISTIWIPTAKKRGGEKHSLLSSHDTDQHGQHQSQR